MSSCRTGFRPLTGCLFLIKGYYEPYSGRFGEGFRPLTGCLFLIPRFAAPCAVWHKSAFCGADGFFSALAQSMCAKSPCIHCPCSRGADSSIRVPHGKVPCNRKLQSYLLSFAACADFCSCLYNARIFVVIISRGKALSADSYSCAKKLLHRTGTVKT